MPIYEFYCSACHRVFRFLSRSVNTTKRPSCPACARPRLVRRASSFAISRAREEPADDGLPEVDPSRLERAMESLAGEAGALEGDDPRRAARVMRRLFHAAGLEPGAGLREALGRLEAGEDPDAIEEELGECLGENPFEGSGDSRLRRLLPATIDPDLYEL